ncbi:MAG: hypothetical protein ACLS7H_05980 [Parasutterella sp.]|uniref:hypothetical protein n=1 Tax=Parasutterella sp. TaxID=2049037 RepID=UPI003991F3F6
MVWNGEFHKMLNSYRPKQKFKSHDDYIRSLAISMGSETFLDVTPHILYRRHSLNQSLLPTQRLKRITKYGLKKFGSRQDLKLICKDLLNGFKDKIESDAQSFIEILLSEDSLKKRFQLICSPHMKTDPPYEELLLKILILFKGID